MRAPIYIVAVALLAPLLLGQMCGMPLVPEAQAPGRLDVTPTLRAACADLGLTSDGEIRTVILGAEADRQAGLTFSEEIDDVVMGCPAFPDPAACAKCMSAIAGQVYGY